MIHLTFQKVYTTFTDLEARELDQQAFNYLNLVKETPQNFKGERVKYPN